MSYRALLFCPDEKTARVVTQVLSELEFRVEPCNEPFAAVKKLMAEHFDAIVVDCDNEQNAALLFKSAHNSGSNQASLAVAVVEGQAGVAKAFRIGANLVLTKPINVEQSKGTLRVARGLLRKSDAAKPATPTPALSPRPAVATAVTNTNALTSIETKRPPAAPLAEPKPAPAHLPVQPLPSAIPAASASVFELEEEPAPELEPAEAALLESMPDPLANKPRAADPIPTPAKEYPWQPIARPAAGAMATALQRAAEAAGKSEGDSSTASKVPASVASVSATPAGASHTSSMASRQAAAAAPAKESPAPEPEQKAETQQVEPPTFSSLGAPSREPASAGQKKTILIAAAVLVAAAAIGYVGWTKLHPLNRTSVAPKLTAPVPAPVQVQPPTPAATTPAASPAQDMVSTPTPSQPDASAAAPPVEQMPDITLSTTEARPPAPKKSTSIVVSNPVVKTPSSAKTPTLVVVRNQAPAPAQPSPALEESAQPPAPGSVGNASGQTSDQAISGMMSTAAVNLPQPAQLKVSQGVSQGLLIKSVAPVYPPAARQMRIQGAVELLANIAKDGSIKAVQVISGDPVLSHAAMDAVRQWKYKPYYLDDQPVEIQTQITVNFKLP